MIKSVFVWCLGSVAAGESVDASGANDQELGAMLNQLVSETHRRYSRLLCEEINAERWVSSFEYEYCVNDDYVMSYVPLEPEILMRLGGSSGEPPRLADAAPGKPRKRERLVGYDLLSNISAEFNEPEFAMAAEVAESHGYSPSSGQIILYDLNVLTTTPSGWCFPNVAERVNEHRTLFNVQLQPKVIVGEDCSPSSPAPAAALVQAFLLDYCYTGSTLILKLSKQIIRAQTNTNGKHTWILKTEDLAKILPIKGLQRKKWTVRLR